MTLPMGRPMREVFGETVAALAAGDPRIVMLDGDVGTSTRADIFEQAHPDRYLQMGIAEQNMLGVAAGLAAVGFIPFPVTFAVFVVMSAASTRSACSSPSHGCRSRSRPGYTGFQRA